jgi:GPH family glycoside/pentoside/hexuronide:cation symporter
MSQVAPRLDKNEAVSSHPLAPTTPISGVHAGIATATSERVSTATAVVFCAQSLFYAAMMLVIAVYMSNFYVDVVLIPAGIFALIIAAGRAFDAMTDPIMGYLTDHTRSRWGRRKPWIFVGIFGAAVTYYGLFAPPASLTGRDATAWFATLFVLNFAFFAMSFVPRQALSVELTLDTSQRHKLYGVAAAFISAGTVLGAIMPALLQGGGVHDPRAQMRIQAAILASGYLALNLALLYFVRERPEFIGRGEVPFVSGVRRALRNKPFRIMFTSLVITAIPQAIPAVLMPFFVHYVLKLDVIKWTGLSTLTYLGSGFLCVPLWVAIARRRGKLAVWMIASFIAVTGYAAFFSVGPGQGGRMLLIDLYVGSQSAAWFFLLGSMQADVVDYDELHTGKRREAQFSALLSIVPKFALVPGAAIPLAVLGAVGYHPNASHQPESVTLTLRLLFAVAPPALNVIGLSIMLWYPLSEAKHREIRAAIAGHARGESVTDPITGKPLSPPDRRGVDEATTWFLDYFSRRELRASLRGEGRVLVSVIAWGAALTALFAAAIVYAVEDVAGLTVDPGPKPALAIVFAGICFAGALFHLLRVRPALRFVRQPPQRDVIVRYLASIEDA